MVQPGGRSLGPSWTRPCHWAVLSRTLTATYTVQVAPPCALIEGFSHRQFTKNLEELKDGMHFALLFFFLFYYYFSTFSLTIYYLNATAKGQKAANLDLKKKMKMVRMRFTETSSYLVSRRKGGVLTAAPVSSGVASAGEQDAEQEDGGRPRR